MTNREEPAMQGCPDYCTHEVQGYPAPCEMYPLESFAGCARACALERLRAAMNERVDAQRAEIAELRAAMAKNQRIVDLVCAEGSRIESSRIGVGYVIAVDGRTGLDARARTAAEAFDILFEEADGGESPGRIGITFKRSAAVSQERQDDR